MALTKAFYEAVQAGNIRRVRIMMQDSLLVDTTFSEFNDMEKVAVSMEGLYDQHDGKELIEDRELWDDNYMDKMMVKALSNFSHERIEHLKYVIQYLRPATKNTASQKKEFDCQQTFRNDRRSSYEENKKRCQECGDYLGTKVGVGAIVGATVGGAIVTAVGAPVTGVIGGVAAGAVAGGVATVIIKGGKDNV